MFWMIMLALKYVNIKQVLLSKVSHEIARLYMCLFPVWRCKKNRKNWLGNRVGIHENRRRCKKTHRTAEPKQQNESHRRFKYMCNNSDCYCDETQTQTHKHTYFQTELLSDMQSVSILVICHKYLRAYVSKALSYHSKANQISIHNVSLISYSMGDFISLCRVFISN